jgi:hypothetical protein
MPKDKPDLVKTSLRIPRALWRKAHMRALDEGKDLQDIVSEALDAYLRRSSR